MKKYEFNKKTYEEDLIKYKEILSSSSATAKEVMNLIMIMAFHELGEEIRKKGELVNEYIKRMPKDFPNYTYIMTEQNIRNMCKFSSLVEVKEIIDLRLYDYTWSELLLFIEASKNHDELIVHLRDERKVGKA